jgi:hypothetical protein
MAFSQDPLSTPETFYYTFEIYYTGDDEIDFQDLDSRLIEIAHNLDANPIHAGAARDFKISLENFDDSAGQNPTGEAVVSFVVRLWEDDDNEIELILSSIKEEMEGNQLMVEGIHFMGTGPPR